MVTDSEGTTVGDTDTDRQSAILSEVLVLSEDVTPAEWNCNMNHYYMINFYGLYVDSVSVSCLVLYIMTPCGLYV